MNRSAKRIHLPACQTNNQHTTYEQSDGVFSSKETCRIHMSKSSLPFNRFHPGQTLQAKVNWTPFHFAWIFGSMQRLSFGRNESARARTVSVHVHKEKLVRFIGSTTEMVNETNFFRFIESLSAFYEISSLQSTTCSSLASREPVLLEIATLERANTDYESFQTSLTSIGANWNAEEAGHTVKLYICYTKCLAWIKEKLYLWYLSCQMEWLRWPNNI